MLAQALLPGMERGEPLAVLDYTNRTIGAVAQLPAFGLGEEGTPLLRPARSVAMAPLPAVWSRGGRR